MSGTTLTIGGGYNGQSGLLPVPTNFGTSIFTTLQNYLNSAAVSVGASGLSSINDDLGTDTVVQANANSAIFQTVTNYDTVSGVPGQYVTNPGASGSVTINPLATAISVEDPAAVTVTGNSSVTLAIFGANSTVTYNAAAARGSIFAAGGANTLNLTGQVSVYSAGNDTLNLDGPNTVQDQVSVLAGGADTISMSESAQATVSATGSAVIRFTANAGGNVDLINGSQSSTVFSGAYGPGRFATNSITVFGGAGGGIFVGGLAGQNSLTGGTGASTLIGGGTGDILTATASLSGGNFNELFTGQGTETLLGATGSSNDVFNIGDFDFGVGNVTATGVVSTNGVNNSFNIFNTNGEVITGSTVSGASNTYVLFGDSTTGGGNLTITNFHAAGTSNFLFLENATGGGSDATVAGVQNTGFGANAGVTVSLSDNTTVFFKGLTTSTLNTTGTVQASNGSILTYFS